MSDITKKIGWNIRLIAAIVTGTASITALMYAGQVGVVFGGHG